uniref:Uncharacterized protein n=1 Tax=Arundo donax TaxID=35708 RepID=A0A0A9CLT6_ARUDO
MCVSVIALCPYVISVILHSGVQIHLNLPAGNTIYFLLSVLFHLYPFQFLIFRCRIIRPYGISLSRLTFHCPIII